DYARTIVPAPIVDEMAGAEIGIIAYGSTDPAIAEARAMLAARGVKTSYLRLRALPITAEAQAFIAKYPRVAVVENNFEGQMARLLMGELPQHAAKINPVTHCDGLPFTGLWIAQSLLGQEQ
ncbi:MAG TPA: hypothetical protein VFY89_05035, partial [Ktedonobacterales bacterium]